MTIFWNVDLRFNLDRPFIGPNDVCSGPARARLDNSARQVNMTIPSRSLRPILSKPPSKVACPAASASNASRSAVRMEPAIRGPWSQSQQLRAQSDYPPLSHRTGLRSEAGAEFQVDREHRNARSERGVTESCRSARWKHGYAQAEPVSASACVVPKKRQLRESRLDPLRRERHAPDSDAGSVKDCIADRGGNRTYRRFARARRGDVRVVD
jgi:hypothetical protein